MNEIYKLTLEHYIVDDFGEKVRLDEPITTQYVVCMNNNISIPILLNNMFDRMRKYLLEIEKC